MDGWTDGQTDGRKDEQSQTHRTFMLMRVSKKLRTSGTELRKSDNFPQKLTYYSSSISGIPFNFYDGAFSKNI